MGCGDAKEHLEEEILNARMVRIELQYERHKQLKLLKDIYNCDIKTAIIPDYKDQNDQKVQREDKKKRTLSKNNDRIKNNHKSETMKIRSKRSKSIAIKSNIKNKLNRIDTNNNNKGKKIKKEQL